MTFLVNKTQFTNDVTGGSSINRKLDFYDKNVHELNDKQKLEVKVIKKFIGVPDISLNIDSNDVRIGWSFFNKKLRIRCLICQKNLCLLR